MIEINVVADTKMMAKDLQCIREAIPRITYRAVNELATWARRQTINETADALRLPRRTIAKTTRRGASVDRFKLYKATRSIAVARLKVQSEGIQVTDVAGAWTGRKPGQGGGVKAKGGRFYKGTFKAPAPGGKVRVWKRKGKDRLPVFLPRIGTRNAMLKAFDEHVRSGAGTQVFRDRFNRLAAYELQKAGVR